MKNKKRILAVIMVITLTLLCIPANATTVEQQTYDGPLTAVDVTNAILNPTAQNKQLLEMVTLKASMGIEFPKLDSSKIIPAYSPKIETLKEKDTFINGLKNHGINKTDITLYEYQTIEASWTMDEKFVDIATKLYPELKEVKLNEWTIGEYQQYVKEQNAIDLKNKFTDAQLLELKKRGIEIEDTFYLLKEFYSPEAIFNQTDATLKSIIESYYKATVSLLLGEDAYYKIAKKE